MKEFKVINCGTCPFYQTDDYDRMCNADEDYRTIESGVEPFPSWCPLAKHLEIKVVLFNELDD